MIRSTEHLEILNEIARIASMDLELRPMLQRVTDAMRQKFGWEFVACVLIDRTHHRFRCEALSTDLPTEVFVGYSRPLGSGVVGEVAATGNPILINDTREHPNYVETQAGTLSELCVPVWHHGETVALLNLESQRLNAFDDQLPLLETVAEQVAGAIASARLHEELQRRARLLEMVGEVSKAAMDAGELGLLLNRVVRYIHDRFPLRVVSILLADLEAGEFTETAHAGQLYPPATKGNRWPLTLGIGGRAMRLGETQLVTDVHADPDYLEVNAETTAELAVPIVYRGQPLGVLNFESDTPDVFTPENLTVFRTFADQLAGAVHMATINQELEAANEQLREANQRLEQQAQLDGLTGIANRRAFDRVLDAEWRRAVRAGTSLCLAMIDIDCFKGYNDRYGHQRGDECLRVVADALRDSATRAGDFVARYGGEEFAVLVPGMDAARAPAFAEKLRACVEALRIPHERSTVSDVVTASVGIATAVPVNGAPSGALVAKADLALYAAKHEGRNRVGT